MATNQGESSTQDNVLKKGVVVGTPENAAGNQSGVTTLISAGGTVSLSNNMGLNGTVSSENRSAKFKYPRVSEEVPEAGRNQYQGQ